MCIYSRELGGEPTAVSLSLLVAFNIPRALTSRRQFYEAVSSANKLSKWEIEGRYPTARTHRRRIETIHTTQFDQLTEELALRLF